MALSVDKMLVYLPIVLILVIFMATFIIEIFGCKWNVLFSDDFSSLFVPGIKVIG
jgi:hypothetical protein